jgi:hypothetical protein
VVQATPHMAGALLAQSCAYAERGTHLEGELQLRPSDDDVGEVQQVDLQGVKHTLSTKTISRSAFSINPDMCLNSLAEVSSCLHLGVAPACCCCEGQCSNARPRLALTLRVTMTRLGCSSTGRERTRAATSSAVFHLASWDRRFWPAHTL